MKRERINYSKEFKIKAVELSIQRGSTIEVARELNIDRKYIQRWKKELYEVKMERDILKKAASIFSKSDR